MTPLSRDARALFERARPAGEPSAEQLARVRAALGAHIGGAAAGANTGTLVAGSAKAAWTGVAIKVAFVAVCIAGAGLAAGRVRASRTTETRQLAHEVAPRQRILREADAMKAPSVQLSATPLASHAEPPTITHALVQHTVIAPAAPRRIHSRPVVSENLDSAEEISPHPAVAVQSSIASSGSDASVEPSADVTPVVDSPALAESHGDPVTLELQTLALVERALRESRPNDALGLLDASPADRRTVPLRQERGALRAIALCMVGRNHEGADEARRLLADAPTSPYAARIRAACGD